MMNKKSLNDDDLLSLQRNTFGYFIHETNSENGLVPDSTRKGSHSSIAAIGLGLAGYPIGVKNNFITRDDAIDRVLTTLRFFWTSQQSTAPDATGYKGFYYHFLHMRDGNRAWECEISTIDTTILIAGVLSCGAYFDRDTEEERELRKLADDLYRRIDWQWALNRNGKVSMGWKPECGFLPYTWEGYNEAILLHVLAIASPTFPIPPQTYEAFTSTYTWEEIYGREQLYAGPLFIHQLSHLWIDFRGIQDRYMREKGIDYFENSCRATYTQQEYAVRNPRQFRGYDQNIWGITASDGPGPAALMVDGVKRHFWDYEARGVPYGPDDGTIAPWAVAASLPFAPEIVLPTLKNFNDDYPEMTSEYGFKCSFNPTFLGAEQSEKGWISKGYYGLDQGPVVIMIENYRTGFVWELMRACPYISGGLRRAGFTGGWLDAGSAGVLACS
jgi:hypothetical protein